MGGFGRSCDRGNGGDRSSGSSSRLLRLVYLPCSPLHVSRNGAWWRGRWWLTREKEKSLVARVVCRWKVQKRFSPLETVS